MSKIWIYWERLHVSDRNVFGVYTSPDIRMHYTRHTRYVQEKYANAFSFGQVACFHTLFQCFLSFYWCLLAERQGKSFVLVSSVIDYKTQLALDGMDLLEIGPLDACKKDFKVDEAMWKTFKSDCAVKGQEKSEGKFLKIAKRREKNRFQVEGNRRAHAQWHPDIRMPRLHVSKEHRDIRMIHLWNRFRTASG